MEPLRKRARISQSTDRDFLHPDFDVQEARTRNDLKLKSTFEAIFRKYEHDFTGVGDEIDLETGEIVVDNGHLMDMRSEHDTGNGNVGRNPGLRAFTTATEQVIPSRLSATITDRWKGLPTGQHDLGVLADIGVECNDEVDSLIGSDQYGANGSTDHYPYPQDMWNKEKSSEGIRRRPESPRMPSEQTIISQFGPSLGQQIANFVSNIRKVPATPVDDIWRTPELATAPAVKRPALKSLLNLRQARSVSPLNHISIWASNGSKSRPRKSAYMRSRRKASTSNNPLKTSLRLAEASMAEGYSDHSSDSEDILGSNQVPHSLKSKGAPLKLPSRADTLPQQDKAELQHIQRSDLDAQEYPLSQAEFWRANHASPQLLSLPETNSLPEPGCLSPGRRIIECPVEQTETPCANKAQFQLRSDEQCLTWGGDAGPGSKADSQTLVSPEYTQPQLAYKKQKKQTSKKLLDWSLQEEALLQPLKANTNVTYSRLTAAIPYKYQNNEQNCSQHVMQEVNSTPQKTRNRKRPAYTSEEDNLLLKLTIAGSRGWKGILASFPGRSECSLRNRYYRTLQLRQQPQKTPTSAQLTDAKTNDHMRPSLLCTDSKLTSNEHQNFPGHPMVESMDWDRTAQPVPGYAEVEAGPFDDTKVDRKTSTDCTGTEDQLAGDTPRVQDSPSSPAPGSVAQGSGNEPFEAIAPDEPTTPILAIARSDHRGTSSSKGLGARRRSPLIHKPQQGSKLAKRKATHAPTSQSRRTPSTKRSAVKGSKVQAAGTAAVNGTPVSGSKTAFISLMPNVSDDEDELSNPTVTVGSAKDLLFTTPKGTVRQCGVDGMRCERPFCFRCA